MTHSWQEEPGQQDLDSLDGWAKSNNKVNCMGINANIFPEILQSHLHAGRGVAFKRSSSEQASRVLVNAESESKECRGCQEKGCALWQH